MKWSRHVQIEAAAAAAARTTLVKNTQSIVLQSHVTYHKLCHYLVRRPSAAITATN